MKKVIIIGAGGHAAEIDEYITHNNRLDQSQTIEVIGFLDDNPTKYRRYQFSAPYLGGLIDHVVNSDISYIIGIANLSYRFPIIEKYLLNGASFLTFIHKSAYISPSAVIGTGCVIAPFVNVGPNVVIGDFTLINSRSSIGHDTIVGINNFICPNVSFSGFSVIGNNNLFGINSATIPGIKVGNNNQISAGMTLDKNVENNEVIFYRFKERIIAKPKT